MAIHTGGGLALGLAPSLSDNNQEWVGYSGAWKLDIAFDNQNLYPYWITISSVIKLGELFKEGKWILRPLQDTRTRIISLVLSGKKSGLKTRDVHGTGHLDRCPGTTHQGC